MMLSENGRGAEARAIVEALPAGAADPAIRALVLGNLALTNGDAERGRLRAGSKEREAAFAAVSTGG